MLYIVSVVFFYHWYFPLFNPIFAIRVNTAYSYVQDYQTAKKFGILAYQPTDLW